MWFSLDRERRLISFDVFRTLGINGVKQMKPAGMFAAREELAEADWVLFPEEWQISPLVHTLGTRIFPSEASYRFGQDKVQFTRAMWLIAPEHMPETLIAPVEDASLEEAIERFGFPLVVKLPRASMGQGVWLATNRAELRRVAEDLQVLYAQEYLEIDRDLRVVWVGDEVVCAYWRIGSNGFHNNISRGGRHEFGGVPDAPLALVRRLARGMGIDHGGFDLACVGGHWFVLEVNVRFGNEALREMGIDIPKRIEAWLERHTPGWQGPNKPDPGEPGDNPPLPLAS